MIAKFRTGLFAVLVENNSGSTLLYRISNDSAVSLDYQVVQTLPTDRPPNGWDANPGIGAENCLDVAVPHTYYLVVGVRAANPQPTIHGTFELLQSF